MARKNNRKSKGGGGNRRKSKTTAPVDPNTPCKFFLEDKCRFGEECKFSHDIPVDAAPVCTVAPAAAEVKPPPATEAAAAAPSEAAKKEDAAKARKRKEVEAKLAVAQQKQKAAAKTNGDSKAKAPAAEEKKETPRKQSSSEGAISGIINSVGSLLSSPFSSKKTLPPGLERSLSLFTPEQQRLAKTLCELPGCTNQIHLFSSWSESPEHDSQKVALLEKLESVDASYPDGGLVGYLANAVDLLEKSRRGENPLEFCFQQIQ